MQPLVCIIILNWNSGQDTLACIESLKITTYSNSRVVVVDNASTDGSPEKIGQEFPEVGLIRNQENLGYTGGNNTGIEHAMSHGADYVWLLNSDTVIAPYCLDHLVKRAEERATAGLFSPVVYYVEQPKRIQFAEEHVSLSNMEKSSGGYWEIKPGEKVVDLLPGTAILIKRAVIEKIGLLQDELFAYWEDTDYCIRAAKAGFENVVVESAAVYHKHQLRAEDGSWKSPHFYYYMLRNKILLGRYHFEGKWERYRYFLHCILKAADIIGNMKPEYTRFYLNGLWHGLNGVTGPMRDESPMPPALAGAMRILSKTHPMIFSDILYGNFGPAVGRIRNFLKTVKAGG